MGHDRNPTVPTHPWISFSLDLGRLPYHVWIAIGECASKCEHISNTPLRPDVRSRLHEIYLAKGVHATTAIEGNTLTEEEVEGIVRKDLRIPPSKAYLKQEADNIVEACNKIGQAVQGGAPPLIGPELLCEYNRLVLRGLDLEEGVVPGEFRWIDVGVGRYRAPGSGFVPQLVDDLCRWLNGSDFESPELDHTLRAILKGIVAHLYVAWIHPFGNGNGRTARLLEFDILLRSGIPSPAVHLLSNHYNATRSEYYRQLDAASKGQNPKVFIAYAVIGFRDGLREQLAIISEMTRDIVWRNYVHEKFSGLPSAAAKRQECVVLDISGSQKPVPRSEVPTLTSRLRKAYARKTDKTVSRDIHKLVGLELLKQQPAGLVARKDLIDAFLPMRKQRPGDTEVSRRLRELSLFE